jgi:DNA-binding Lrp family transcriptional regulator
MIERKEAIMITAFVITVPSKHSGDVVEALRKHPEVQEAAAVYGDTDIIVKVQAPSLIELDQVIMDGIQGSPDVKTTRTYLVVEKLHWKR